MDVCDRFYVKKCKLPLLYAGMLDKEDEGTGLPVDAMVDAKTGLT